MDFKEMISIAVYGIATIGVLVIQIGIFVSFSLHFEVEELWPRETAWRSGKDQDYPVAA